MPALLRQWDRAQGAVDQAAFSSELKQPASPTLDCQASSREPGAGASVLRQPLPIAVLPPSLLPAFFHTGRRKEHAPLDPQASAWEILVSIALPMCSPATLSKCPRTRCCAHRGNPSFPPDSAALGAESAVRRNKVRSRISC